MSKNLVGFVSANKTNKTIVVRVVTHKIHPIYKKRYISSKKYQVHDETNEANVGDEVSIVETRPVSAHKHFKLDKIIAKATIKHEEEEPVL
jgi:small subunit ribosomal protein S17